MVWQDVFSGKSDPYLKLWLSSTIGGGSGAQGPSVSVAGHWRSPTIKETLSPTWRFGELPGYAPPKEDTPKTETAADNFAFKSANLSPTNASAAEEDPNAVSRDSHPCVIPLHRGGIHGLLRGQLALHLECWDKDVVNDDFIGFSKCVVRSNFQINDVRVLEVQLFPANADPSKAPQPQGAFRLTVRFVLVLLELACVAVCAFFGLLMRSPACVWDSRLRSSLRFVIFTFACLLWAVRAFSRPDRFAASRLTWYVFVAWCRLWLLSQ